ncbi:MAG: hypothetical protein GXO00_03220 [Candidatus Diapherotrites archaeon]|nr:hypothetical protein [Candidatus Diapherotrites archaeon]
MRGQVTVDTLINAAVIAGLLVIVLSAFYTLYDTAERGLRLMHLKYLSTVIEDRMKACNVLDGAKVYAPYEVNLLCSEGKLCWKDLCVEVNCEGGGSGKTFILRDCSIEAA